MRPYSRKASVRVASVGVLALLLVSAILCLPALAEKVEELQYQGYVNDFAGVLRADAKAQLTALCVEVDQKTQAQIAVVTVKTTDDMPIEEFANTIFRKWGVGAKGTDRGILILLAVNDHKNRFETGYGLEGILPDGKTGGFAREAVPLLRTGDYGSALYLMTRRVADVIAADKGVTLTGASPERLRESRGRRNSGSPFVALIVIGLVILLILIANRTNPPSNYTGRRRGGGSWWIGPFIGGGWGGGGFGGGGWGGGGGFGGGGGGFGGFGGGSSGGGGSTGSW